MEHKIIYLNPAELVEYDKNSRTHSHDQIEQVARSIQEYGFTNPVLVDENNVIIAGHGRKAAATKLGLERIPVIRLSGLSEAQIKALRIADNKLALNSSWDVDMLQAELADLSQDGYDLSVIGFSGSELDELLAAETEQQEEEDIPEDFEEVEETKLAHKCPRCGFEFDDK